MNPPLPIERLVQTNVRKVDVHRVQRQRQQCGALCRVLMFSCIRETRLRTIQ